MWYNGKMSYSADFKKLILQHRKDGYTVDEICELTGIARSTYYEWKKSEHGAATKRKRCYEKKICKEELKKAVEEKPDSYLRELAEQFDCTPQAVFKALKAMKITLKKRHLPTQKNPKKSGVNS